MTDKTIKFTSKRRNGWHIEIEEADPPVDAVKIGAGAKIAFVNNLRGQTKARIEFFRVGDGKADTINGFCQNSGDYFDVPKDRGTNPPHSKICTVTQPADAYGYKVTAVDGQAHEPLDPVIIIQPSLDAPLLPVLPPIFTFGGIAIVVLAGIAAFFGARAGAARRDDIA